MWVHLVALQILYCFVTRHAKKDPFDLGDIHIVVDQITHVHLAVRCWTHMNSGIRTAHVSESRKALPASPHKTTLHTPVFAITAPLGPGTCAPVG